MNKLPHDHYFVWELAVLSQIQSPVYSTILIDNPFFAIKLELPSQLFEATDCFLGKKLNIEIEYYLIDGVLHRNLGIFPQKVKNIILQEVRLNPCEVRQTSGNFKNLENYELFFGWRVHLVTIFHQFTFFNYSTSPDNQLNTL